MTHGDYLVSGLWAAYASAILVAGMVLRSRQVQMVGLATIVATVGKLIIIDMHQAETIWRVGVFVGMGVVLLAISYLSPTLRGHRDENSSPEDAE